MVKLIQDLTTIGPMLFIAILILSAFCAVWLITQLHLKNNGRVAHTQANLWFLKRNTSRLKKMGYH